MKKTIYQLAAIFTAVALVACGRPSSSNYFGLDGVGDPDNPIVGNPIPGKWGGGVNFTNYHMLPPSFSAGLFGGSVLPEFLFPQAFFNTSEIAGIGGWNLLVNSSPPPPRLAFGQVVNCYMDAVPGPLLGGNLNSPDVGDEIEVNPDGANNTYAMERLGAADDVPGADEILFWYTILDPSAAPELLPFGEPIEMSWSGGVLDGYKHAPPLQEQEIIEYPEMLMTSSALPLVEGAPMTALIPEDEDYLIEWDRQSGTSDVIGIVVVVSVYGPTNLGTASGGIL